MMVVLGLMGMAAMGILQINSNSIKGTKTSEIGMEVNAVVNSITQNLLNQNSCTNTFSGIGAINDGLTISDIKNRTGQILFNKVNKYGNNRLKINEMTINGVTIKPPDPGVTNSYGEFKLQIKLEKIGKGYHGQPFVTKTVPLQGEFSPSKNLVKCYSSTEDAVYTAKKQSCEDIGGSWSISADRCDLSTSKGRSIAASTQDLDDQIQDLKDNYLVNNYVKKAGDTMTGDLTLSDKDLKAKDVSATNKVIATTSLCVGTKCRDFSTKSCNKDSVTIGINEDGSPICLALTCGEGKYLEKIDSTGNPVCKLIPTGTCLANTYVSKVNTDGSVECSPLPTPANQDCPVGEYVKGMGTDGLIKCAKLPTSNIACGSNSYVEKYDVNGVPKCKYTGTLKMRRKCGDAPTITTYKNESSGGQYIDCPSGKFLKQLTFWANDAIDYVKSYVCCSLELYYDPPHPEFADPTLSISFAEEKNVNNYNRYSDNTNQSNACGDNQVMAGISFGFENYLEYVHNAQCYTISLSNYPEGETKKPHIESCTWPVTTYSNSLQDNMEQTTNCTDENKYLMGINIHFGGGGEYIVQSKCCQINLW